MALTSIRNSTKCLWSLLPLYLPAISWYIGHHSSQHTVHSCMEPHKCDALLVAAFMTLWHHRRPPKQGQRTAKKNINQNHEPNGTLKRIRTMITGNYIMPLPQDTIGHNSLSTQDQSVLFNPQYPTLMIWFVDCW